MLVEGELSQVGMITGEITGEITARMWRGCGVGRMDRWWQLRDGMTGGAGATRWSFVV